MRPALAAGAPAHPTGTPRPIRTGTLVEIRQGSEWDPGHINRILDRPYVIYYSTAPPRRFLPRRDRYAFLPRTSHPRRLSFFYFAFFTSALPRWFYIMGLAEGRERVLSRSRSLIMSG